ncbi:hypothetical protein N7455_000525 [Penicillium solitum]|uniref:uncharacterized protein n=1 Tax=Penicillium solitum TaxID=60172 RepID=UPI0032C44CC4|nr:hypothetical protein N7455_000525 [Penicillium solitum]
MIRALQERLLSIGAISSRESIVRVPYIAHMIQLYLKQLLGHIRAAPKNKEFTMALMKTRDVIIYSETTGVYRTVESKIEEKDNTLEERYYKLSAFDNREYSTCHKDTSKRYCEYLRASFTQYQQQNPKLLFRTVQRSSNSYSTELDRLLEPPGASIFHKGVEYDEVDQYLREGTSNHQEALKEDKALKAIEEDAEPISDNEEIEESENLEGNSEPEETYQVQCTVVETGRSSIHRHIHEPKQQEESMEEDVVDYDEADLLPPPIMQLSDRSQKRSSGRVTMPSSRLRGYEVY